MELTCPVCGKVFVRQNGRQIFCCVKCKNKHYFAVSKENRDAHPKMRTCVVCGKSFSVFHGQQSTCSSACRLTHAHELARACRERHAVHRFYKCHGCGKVFKVVGHWYRYCETCRSNGFGKSSTAREARSEYGLTEKEKQAVIYDQDIRPFCERYEASKLWTPKQRKFAISRYNQKHGLSGGFFG